MRFLGFFLFTSTTLLAACNCGAGSGGDQPSDWRFLNEACQVDGDCGPAHSCVLGYCTPGCESDADCGDEESCDAHGVCLNADGEPARPPSLTASGVTLSQERTVISRDASSATVTLENNSGRTVHYRLVSQSPGLEFDPVPVELGPGATAEISVDVDFSKVGPGVKDLPLGIVTDEETIQWDIEVEEVATGLYAGGLSFGDADIVLGASSLTMNLTFEEGGTVVGQTFSDGTFLWPQDIVVRGTWDDSGAFSLDVEDILAPATPDEVLLGPLGRDVGRQVALTGSFNPETGAINGSAELTYSGLGDALVKVDGSFQMHRRAELAEATEPADYADDLPLFAPNEPFPDQFDEGACSGLGTDYGTEAILGNGSPELAACDACEIDCTAAEAATCAEALLYHGFLLDDSSELTQAMLEGDGDDAELPEASFWDSCVNDESPTYPDVADPRVCVDRAAIRCASVLAKAAFLGGEPAVVLLDAALAETTMASVLGTERQIEAAFSFIDAGGGDVATAEIEKLTQAQDLQLPPMSIATSSGYIDALAVVGKAQLVGTREGKDLETALTVATKWAESTTQRFQVETRKAGMNVEQLRVETQYVAAWIHATGALWGHVYDVYEIDDEARILNGFGDAVTTLKELHERLEPGTNGFGVPPDLVPILLTPEQAAMGVQNYSLLADAATNSIAFYAGRLDQAQMTLDNWEQSGFQLSDQIASVAEAYDEQIGTLCGWNGEDPNYETCGDMEGELYQLQIDSEQGALLIEEANLRVWNLNMALQDEEASWWEILDNSIQLQEQIDGKRDELVTILDENGNKRNGLREAHTDYACTLRLEQLQDEKKTQKKRCKKEIHSGLNPNYIPWPVPSDPVGAAMTPSICKAEREAMTNQANRDCDLMRDEANLQNHLEDINTQEQIDVLTINGEIDDLIRQSTLKDRQIEHKQRVSEIKRQITEQLLAVTQAEKRSLAADAAYYDGLARVASLMSRKQRALSRLGASPTNPLANPKFMQARLEYGRSLVHWRERAARSAYLAGRALEYHLNGDLAIIEADLLPARTDTEFEDFMQCANGIFLDYTQSVGVPQQFVTELSLRDDVLLLSEEDEEDKVNGEPITPAERFRAFLFEPDHVLPDGSLEFPVNIALTENSPFSSLLCNDTIESIQIKAIGDYVGDNEIDIFFQREGAGALRRCDAQDFAGEEAQLVRYGFEPRTALIQAGANDYGLAQPNGAYAGWPVGGAEWMLRIPSSATSPANADVDLESLSDIVIKVTHRAGSVGAIDYTPSCL